MCRFEKWVIRHINSITPGIALHHCAIIYPKHAQAHHFEYPSELAASENNGNLWERTCTDAVHWSGASECEVLHIHLRLGVISTDVTEITSSLTQILRSHDTIFPKTC